jgi:hypothetical protein
MSGDLQPPKGAGRVAKAGRVIPLGAAGLLADPSKIVDIRAGKERAVRQSATVFVEPEG